MKFFAKYCEPCKESLPWVEKLAVERTDVLVVGIAEDERESQVRELATAHGLTFPIVHDVGNGRGGGDVSATLSCVTGDCAAIAKLAAKVVRSEGGPGGPGGPGGAGGPGGQGGSGGSGASCTDSQGHFRSVSGGSPGPRGADGSPGMRGPNGAPGAPGNVKIRVVE